SFQSQAGLPWHALQAVTGVGGDGPGKDLARTEPAELHHRLPVIAPVTVGSKGAHTDGVAQLVATACGVVNVVLSQTQVVDVHLRRQAPPGGRRAIRAPEVRPVVFTIEMISILLTRSHDEGIESCIAAGANELQTIELERQVWRCTRCDQP